MLDLRERSRLGLLTGAALAGLLLAPLLGPGYVLTHDMVFVPRVPLGGQLLGLDGVPRGVPSELVLALASRVVAAGWLQDLVLLVIVVGGAWGAARLAPTTSRFGVVAAGTTYGWSAYLHERLLLGQWALLVGWAVLPWAVRAALDWRRGGPGWWAIAALSTAALAGANALVLVGLAVVVCGRPLKALLATAVLSLPWVVPGLLQGIVPGDRHAVAAFAANADTPFGVLGSLLTGGGVWSRDAVPPGRAAGSYLAVLVLLVAGVGLTRVRARLGARLLLLAVLGLFLSLLGTVPGLRDGLEWAVEHVPAAGLLRDSQKWVCLLVLTTSAAVACGVEALLARVADRAVHAIAGGLLALVPVAALPGAAWGESRSLTVSHYPSAWTTVTGQADGAVLVLPWALYRAFPWTNGKTVLDPAVKLLQRPVVNDALPLPDRAIRGEDPVTAALDVKVREGEPLSEVLRRAGVRQVLVERTTRGFDQTLADSQTRGLDVVVSTSELALYSVPGECGTDRVALAPVVVADVVAAGFALLSVLMAVRVRRRSLPEA